MAIVHQSFCLVTSEQHLQDLEFTILISRKPSKSAFFLILKLKTQFKAYVKDVMKFWKLL